METNGSISCRIEEPRRVLQASTGRLYPSRGQAREMARIGGQVRGVWNHFLALNRDRYAEDGTFAFYAEMSAMLPALRREDERLKGVPHRCAQMAVKALDQALKDSFKSKGGARKGFPRFKKAGVTRDAFQFAGREARIEQGSGSTLRVKLPVLGWVRCRGLKVPEGAKLLRVTVRHGAPRLNPGMSAAATGRLRGRKTAWELSIQFEAPVKSYPEALSPAIGIDLGLKDLAVLSDGARLPLLKQRAKLLKRQRRLNRERDRRRKGSVNRRRTNARLARLHGRVANVRSNHQHQTTNALVAAHEGLAIETLAAKGLMRTRMAGSMSDAGLGELRRQIVYKADWAGRPVYEHPTFQRSTGVCPVCDWHGPKLPLSVRAWTCEGCGTVHDRDVAAAQVLLLRSPFGELRVPSGRTEHDRRSHSVLRRARESWGAQDRAPGLSPVGQALPEPLRG